jgi:ADP-ribose pyrophosphatase YjhB (NUDIX family)
MAIPDFIRDLRAAIGHRELWLSGVTAVVLRGDRVLLVRRADTGEWTPVTGIVDPGEEPADAAAREILEETAIRAIPECLVSVRASDLVVYENGDRARYLDHVFRCRWEGGDPYPADGENTEAAWFALDALPPMTALMTRRFESAIRGSSTCEFILGGQVRGG